MKRGFKAGFWRRAGLRLAMAGLALCAGMGAQAQYGTASLPDAPANLSNLAMNVPDAPQPTHPMRPNELPGRLPDKPSLAPVFTIPVEPLGFSAPGSLYLGQRNSLVSLDFLDENRLLFTFRVPGLIRREGGEGGASVERQIRALVLALPSGAVAAEALWTVHDRARYLWTLNDGHFLLRDRDSLERGDATLQLKPFLRFPGPLVWLEMDPEHKFLVADSREPAVGAANLGVVPSPETASADIEVDGQKSAADQPEMAVRILSRETGKVMLMSRIRSTIHLPLNSDGYLESLRGRGTGWLLNLKYFSGGSTIVGQVDSACAPQLDFVSKREVLVTSCSPTGDGRLSALATNGRHLWEDRTSDTTVWPLLVMGPDCSRLAREALAVSRAVSARVPLDRDDIKGQLVQVLNAADGKVALETTASPIFDAGGNVAISPSGRWVAVLNAGAIQVFELPTPPPLPDSASQPVQ
jgi:hypothetical protein